MADTLVSPGPWEGKSMYNIVSGIVFALVAAAHLVRALYSWPIQVADWSIPIAVSWIAVLGAGGLAAWSFMARPGH